MATRKEFDIVVLGAGLMGSSAAWHLAKEGQKVLLLEQQEAEYTFGSSFGEARICRSLGPKNDIWSYLHRRSVSEAEELIAYLNQASSGGHAMEDIYTTSPVTYILHTDKKEVVKRMLRQQHDDYQCATTPEEAQALFEANTFGEQIIIQEHKPHTGTINPKRLIEKLHSALRLMKNQVLFKQKVIQVRKNSQDDGFEIEVLDTARDKKEVFQTSQIVSAMGPFNGQVLRSFSKVPLASIAPKRVFLAFFKIDRSKYQKLTAQQRKKVSDFLPLIDVGPSYHFAMIENFDIDGIPLIKSGGHFQRSDIDDLDQVWQKPTTAEETQWSKDQLLDYFKMLNLPIGPEDLVYDHGYSCVYSLTQSEVPIVDFLPDNEHNPTRNFILMGGMSGVGAKGALTYGKMAANLLLGGREDGFMYKKTLRKLSFEGR